MAVAFQFAIGLKKELMGVNSYIMNAPPKQGHLIMTKPIYQVHYTAVAPPLEDSWEWGCWRHTPYLTIENFRPESSDHRPVAQAKLRYSDSGIHGIFKVDDRYVIYRHSRFQDPVYKDSCVEFFLKPIEMKGYFNFEFNCGGALKVGYITDSTRIEGGFKEIQHLTLEEGRQIIIHPFQRITRDIEISEPITWQISFYIPFKLLQIYTGPFRRSAGKKFSANFFKCADESSHPHWASWSPVNRLNFHLPHCFGTLELK